MFNFLRRKEGQVKYLHVALDIKGVEAWSQENKASLEDGYLKSFNKLKEVMKMQVREGFPILSVLILPGDEKKNKELLNALKEFTEEEFFLDFLNENKIKITLLGKWYDLPFELLENLKKLMEQTKDYDGFFVNFCLNYDGKEEIVDAFKLIARQITAGKLSLENIGKELIKESIYSSYFIPPDIMVKNYDNKMDSFFLWDCVGARRVFTEKKFPDLDLKWLDKVLKE